MSLCLAGGGVVAKLALAAFTLTWLHTIEHTRWQEDWTVAGDRLVIVAARVENSGAGMDPPAGSVRVGDFWQWHPHVPPLPEVVLRRAPMAGDWNLCAGGTCHPFGYWLPADADPGTMKPCK
jgi:hypothetical protein